MAATTAGQFASAITREQFEEMIHRAVNDHNRVYNNSFALSIRWEQDDTDAARDTEDLQSILSTLNLNQAEVEILAAQDRTPGWTLGTKLISLFQRAVDARGKSLVILHYTGHGELRQDNLFAVEGPTRRSVNLQRIIDCLVAGNIAGDVQYVDIADTDVILILDCCYSHIATRALNPTTRVVEILAASDDRTPAALAPPRNTLSGKLRGEISRRKRDGHHFVELSDVMATLRRNSSVVTPTHQVKLGQSIRLPLTGTTRVNPHTITPTLRAVFSVRIVEDLTQQQLDSLITWIQTLPHGYRMELDGVYETTSTLLVFQSSYRLFANITGHPGVTFISDVTSANRRQSLGQERGRHASPSSILKENVPFSGQSKP